MAKSDKKVPDTLGDFRAQMNKKYGDGKLTLWGDRDDAQRIPTGLLPLDNNLGGGVPISTLCELYGPSGAGKSALSMLLLAQAQALGFPCALVDLEGGMNKYIAQRCGVDMDTLEIVEPDSGEKIFSIIEDMLVFGKFGVIIVDSVAAMMTEAELAGDYSDAFIANKARLMSKGLPKLVKTMRDSKAPTILSFVNQVRDNIKSGPGYGPSEVTTGGHALGFYATLRLEVKKGQQIKGAEGEDPIGHTVRVKVIKNRTAPPLQTCNLKLYYDRGISNSAALIDMGVEEGFVGKSGSWYTHLSTGEKLGNGMVAAMNALDADPMLTGLLSQELHAASTFVA